MDIYREYILDLYKNPLNKKRLPAADVSGQGDNASCGDVISMQLRFENDIVIDIGFQGDGCAISQAAASLITDEVKGKSIADIALISDGQMMDMLQIPISHTRHKCALLALKTIKKAIE
ncbi:MAG: Fe-S cluster protein [Candidatus Magasanikbacteria bacterium CG10_big_fil_rev_8_21_14_0_10_47_10]|uniref:Fe-S cluster protein n=1 Tax=Candidatus Magasanikbacteria bacterium CG10_big_fil_rev_8_21_14_0_10_47_10 TaxID=1974652 RepID=A0A2H0TRC2_9BACT|nr:MAG: Fe-S cluster protein [Candidatus Magasanikbacteria bacterium CG10_big_fil_rev_8_21_14_0_10_47_10]